MEPDAMTDRNYSLSFSVQPQARNTRPAPPPAQPFDLFETRIWQIIVGDPVGNFQSWINAVTAMREAQPISAGRSNRSGWNSTDKAVLERPLFADLRAAIHAQCRYALDEMGLAGTAIALESWVNIHDRGGFNQLHMHDGCLLSGVFYLQVPEGSGALCLRDPRPGVINGFAKGDKPNARRTVEVAPESGLMVLFPHWLEHHVDVHDADIPRISIGFNAILPR